MQIQSRPRVANLVAKRTSPTVTVPGAVRGRVALAIRLAAGPADQVLRDVAVGILLAHNLVDLVLVQSWRHLASARLQVVRQTCGGGEAVFAEGTVDG